MIPAKKRTVVPTMTGVTICRSVHRWGASATRTRDRVLEGAEPDNRTLRTPLDSRRIKKQAIGPSIRPIRYILALVVYPQHTLVEKEALTLAIEFPLGIIDAVDRLE